MSEHRPLEVISAEGMPFVRCSCRDDFKPQSAVWLREHWQGDEASGVAAIRAVVARQRADAEPRLFTADEVIEIANEAEECEESQ